MKVHLLHPDRDPAPGHPLPQGSEDLLRDLGLDDVLDVMGHGDRFVRDVALRTILAPLALPEEIRWRQEVLADLRADPEAAAVLYALSIEALSSQKTVHGWLTSRSPGSVLATAVQRLEVLMGPLRSLRAFADDRGEDFASPALRDLVRTVRSDLSDDYFGVLEDHLRRLRFPAGVVMTARLGPGLKSSEIVLRRPQRYRRRWSDILGLRLPDPLAYVVPDRDEAGAEALWEIRDRGLSAVAAALARSIDHILDFFATLRWEVAFYLGCLELERRMTERSLPIGVPVPHPARTDRLQARGLVDLRLGLAIGGKAVGNDISANRVRLLLFTGTNQGGKSTLLRAVGLAQLMMQSGMAVAATEFASSIAPQVHTHFTREEDPTMTSGKLDEELVRMSRIVDVAGPGDLVLFNESFACTNEREGSLIAHDILDGLTACGLRAVFVTHMFTLGHALFTESRPDVLFLRPERLDDGRRTFRMLAGAPQPTSHGQDLYARIFEVRGAPAP